MLPRIDQSILVGVIAGTVFGVSSQNLLSQFIVGAVGGAIAPWASEGNRVRQPLR